MFSKPRALEPGLPDRDTRLDVFESIISVTQNGVVVTTPDGHAVYVNPAFTEITGYSRDHVIGKNMRLLQSGRQSQSFYEAMWQALLTEGRWAGTIWNRRRDGEVVDQTFATTMLGRSARMTIRRSFQPLEAGSDMSLAIRGGMSLLLFSCLSGMAWCFAAIRRTLLKNRRSCSAAPG